MKTYHDRFTGKIVDNPSDLLPELNGTKCDDLDPDCVVCAWYKRIEELREYDRLDSQGKDNQVQ